MTPKIEWRAYPSATKTVIIQAAIRAPKDAFRRVKDVFSTKEVSCDATSDEVAAKLQQMRLEVVRLHDQLNRVLDYRGGRR
ncbi:hypothetical protein ACPTFP_21185 [Pseudomonas aeruginosa]|uniref:hypothetical protein n=1 Tax=Pseudomonas aeruginosa TaxID=287 RepID=UPI00044EC387|nr:hypothetical protein [Pseudomonas aeruginosa]KAJ09090.1 hypothetical protein M003_18045 [Pseudomonas aeruginosa IGB83]MBG4400727.1 hypothetical protein [Pseudomonas aeruginosa]MBG7570835.1 hypothetical protein [Pseudomonas aeruginosa]OHW58428.1 hypothetical protein ABI36_0214145 [Pseudomonas aeruginosa]HBO5129160.1 hypothetical protein [Pseudomonas aeruginosa]